MNLSLATYAHEASHRSGFILPWRQKKKIWEENRCTHHMCNCSFAEIMNCGQESVSSLKGEVAERAWRKIEKRNTLLGTCLTCLSRPRLPSHLIFSCPISLPRDYFSSRRQYSPSPRCTPRPTFHLVFLVGFRKVRCSVLVAVLPPFRIRSEGLKPAKLRNRVT